MTDDSDTPRPVPRQPRAEAGKDPQLSGTPGEDKSPREVEVVGLAPRLQAEPETEKELPPGPLAAVLGPEASAADLAGAQKHRYERVFQKRATSFTLELEAWIETVSEFPDAGTKALALADGVRELGLVVESLIQALSEKGLVDRGELAKRADEIESKAAEAIAIAKEQSRTSDEGDEPGEFAPRRPWPGN